MRLVSNVFVWGCSKLQRTTQNGVAMEIRRIHATDWDWIQQWFQDEDLNRELGPLDQEWLEHVLNQSDGVQLVAEQNGQPIGLIGCAWGDGRNLPHAITDIAVAPPLRGNGQAGAMLEAVLAWPGHPPCRKWVAFVFPENQRACRFFTRLGWEHVDFADGMNEFEYKCVRSEPDRS